MKRNDYSDLSLVKLIVQKRKDRYFEIIYDRYAELIYSKCFSFLKEDEEAKDVTQEIFIKIYLNLSKFKGNSKFSTWVYSITVNTCIGYAQKKRNKSVLKQEFVLQNVSPFLDGEESASVQNTEETYERLDKILKELRPAERALLFMKYEDNLTVNEIVVALGVSESAVKMRLKRARSKVLRGLKEL